MIRTGKARGSTAAFIGVACAVLALTVFIFDHAHGAPRACDPRAGGSLNEGDTGVRASPTSLRNPEGSSIPVTVFSLANSVPAQGGELSTHASGDSLVDMCLRYELRNNSRSHTITDLRWKDVDLSWYQYPIEPGDQPPGWVVKAQNVLPTPKIFETTLRAFRKKETSARAFFPVRYQRVIPNHSGYLTPSKLRPDLAYTLLMMGFKLRPVPALTKEMISNSKHQTLSSAFYVTEKRGVTLQSTLTSEAEGYSIHYKVDAAEGVDVAAPLFISLRELSLSPTNEDSIHFAKSVNSFSGSLENIGVMEFDLGVSYGSARLGENVAFIVDHPVTIKTEDGVACVMQQAYSPVPIHIPESQCDLSEEIKGNW